MKADDASLSTDGELRTLGVEYIPQCVHVMAQAFADSPAYKFIFQGSQTYRIQALEWLFQRNLDLMLSKSPSCLKGIANPNGEIICCFMWVPSHMAKLSMGEMIMAGMWQIPFRFGWSTLRRLVSLLNDMEGTMGKIPNDDKDENSNNNNNNNNDDDDNTKEYIMLQRMVVVPELQGQGVGNRALRAMFSTASNTTTGAWPRIYLDTQEESNVRFYEKLGWTVTSSRDFFQEDVDYQFHSWQMVHPGGRPVH